VIFQKGLIGFGIRWPQNGFLWLLAISFLLWAVWVVQLVLVGPEFGFAYGVSLFVVPIFLILDSLLGWLLSTINEPGSAQVQEPDDSLPEPPEAHVAFFYFRTFTRVFLVVGIGLWIMSLWGKKDTFLRGNKGKGYGGGFYSSGCLYFVAGIKSVDLQLS